MTTIHPPLAAEDFETQYDNKHRYMFIEHEDGDMFYTYGHDRDDEFARQVREYDIEIGGMAAEDVEEITAEDVGHYWAVTVEPKPEWRFTWRDIDEKTPGAFPVSVIFR